ncbi:hypothetical protein NLM33_26335 [Bradyrhizobium sp. CCGUVB1N3]|uniref:hypothetical protein n=1 Tax=Bradyrhizobium sp. CCGUVB1N3 TaxID=2949629 RepID=UPI0020B1ECF5|nr:hypothetical protein [Bradyrhizobium sp. CCGUVB1N3]MCP3473838.1 hypothetical protein [Bradyrhizobium sp. CCGUVB1N3]
MTSKDTDAAGPLRPGYDDSATRELITIEQTLIEAGRKRDGCTEWTGIGLSGGGIRAATFCLGALQALASQDVLKAFDYSAPRRRRNEGEHENVTQTSSSLAAREMGVGPPDSDYRIRVQTTTSCVGTMAEVVSVVGKSGRHARQVSLRKASGNEPPMKHRKLDQMLSKPRACSSLGTKSGKGLYFGQVATGVKAARS